MRIPGQRKPYESHKFKGDRPLTEHEKDKLRAKIGCIPKERTEKLVAVLKGFIPPLALISEHSADIVASPSLAEFLLRDWSGAGRVRLTVTEIGREDLLIPEVKIQKVQDTVSSMRLDAVVATAFGMSRGKAADLIAAGRVSLDHVPCEKSDKSVAEGSTVTARGFGKAVVRECSRLSKKGRIILLMDRYI